MLSNFHIYRSNVAAQDAEHLRVVRAVLNVAVGLLKENPAPDSFMGRKTQEPFPKEEE